jgi:hypothetical protein
MGDGRCWSWVSVLGFDGWWQVLSPVVVGEEMTRAPERA